MATKKLDLRNPIYHNENAAREHLETVLWPQGRSVRDVVSWVIG
jgi:hypothetical protein